MIKVFAKAVFDYFNNVLTNVAYAGLAFQNQENLIKQLREQGLGKSMRESKRAAFESDKRVYETTLFIILLFVIMAKAGIGPMSQESISKYSEVSVSLYAIILIQLWYFLIWMTLKCVSLLRGRLRNDSPVFRVVEQPESQDYKDFNSQMNTVAVNYSLITGMSIPTAIGIIMFVLMIISLIFKTGLEQVDNYRSDAFLWLLKSIIYFSIFLAAWFTGTFYRLLSESRKIVGISTSITCISLTVVFIFSAQLTEEWSLTLLNTILDFFGKK